MNSKSPIPFRGFDERGEVRIYHHGILPHWRQRGCTYFVTFRLVDSLPAPVLRELEHQRNQWLGCRGIQTSQPGWQSKLARLPPEERRAYERHVAVLLDKFLDVGHGACVLQQPSIAALVDSALNHFHETRVLAGDFVVMPNHVHVLMTPIDGFELEDLLKSIKGFTARQMNQELSSSGPVWQRESHNHIVRDAEQLEAFQRYIAANPQQAGLRSDQYIHSAATYCEQTT